MGLDTQFKEVKGDTLESYSTNGFKCTKINISEKDPQLSRKKDLKIKRRWRKKEINK